MQDYTGARSLSALQASPAWVPPLSHRLSPPPVSPDIPASPTRRGRQAFAEKNLKPLCTPTNKETCSAAELSELQRAVTMSDEELDAAIQTKEAAIQAAGALFTKKSDELRKREVALAEAHKAALAALQDGDTPLKGKSIKFKKKV